MIGDVRLGHKAVLAVIAVGLDRAGHLVRPTDPVAAVVVGVAVAVILEQLVVRVAAVEAAQVRGEAVILIGRVPPAAEPEKADAWLFPRYLR